MYTKNSKFLIILTLVLALTSCKHTTTRVSSDYQSYFVNNPKFAILPPVVHVHEVGFSGGEKKLYDFEYNLEQIIEQSLLDIMRSNGFANVQLLKRKDLHELELLGRTNAFLDDFETRDNEIYGNKIAVPEKENKIDKYIGMQLEPLNQATGSNLVVLLRYTRAIKSKGSQVASLFFSLLAGNRSANDAADQSLISLFLVDCKTGKVIWTNKGLFIYSEYFSSDNKAIEAKNIANNLLHLIKPLFNKK